MLPVLCVLMCVENCSETVGTAVRRGGGDKINGHPIKEDGKINVKEHYPQKLLPDT